MVVYVVPQERVVDVFLDYGLWIKDYGLIAFWITDYGLIAFWITDYGLIAFLSKDFMDAHRINRSHIFFTVTLY
jgi:hypothetical protein